MKATLKLLTLIALLSMTLMLHAAPVNIDYQEAFNSTAFGGPTAITSMSWGYWPFAGPAVILGGNYSFWWGYSANGLGLSSNLASNYSGAATFLGTASVPAGGVNYGTILTLTGINFTYDPSQGDLLFEIVASNQDNVPNTGANGYNWADYTGTDVTRAYCVTNVGCFSGVGALVTTFDGSITVGSMDSGNCYPYMCNDSGINPAPEPGTLVMFGSGLLGLAGIARRKFNL